MKARFSCPLCGRKHFTREQVIECMEMDQKEQRAKKRKLLPVSQKYV